MANHKDAAKRAIQAEKRRIRNRSWRTQMRNRIKELRATVAGTDAELTQEQFRTAVSTIQKLAAKGVIHKNQAARRVKRLAAAVKKQAEAAK